MINLPIWLFIILLTFTIFFFITLILFVIVIFKVNDKMDKEYIKYMNEIYYRKGGEQ